MQSIDERYTFSTATIPIFPAQSVEAALLREFIVYCEVVTTEFRLNVLGEYPGSAKKLVLELFLKEKLLTAELCLQKARDMAEQSSLDYFAGAIIYWQSCVKCINWLISQAQHAKKWQGS